ncbi:MAG: hypothetical protein ACK4X1_02950 [Terricaulis sp.]
MTLATATEMTRPRRVRLKQTGRLALSVDAALMTASLLVCALLFAQGGLEVSLFAAIGACWGARQAPRGARFAHAYSGGFAGLFVGALFAAFFHDALVAALQLL